MATVPRCRHGADVSFDTRRRRKRTKSRRRNRTPVAMFAQVRRSLQISACVQVAFFVQGAIAQCVPPKESVSNLMSCVICWCEGVLAGGFAGLRERPVDSSDFLVQVHDYIDEDDRLDIKESLNAISRCSDNDWCGRVKFDQSKVEEDKFDRRRVRGVVPVVNRTGKKRQ